MYIWKVRLENGREYNVVSHLDNRSDVWNRLVAKSVFRWHIREVKLVGPAQMID